MKYYGEIGFWVEDVEVKPDVYKPQMVPKMYKIDVLRNSQRWQNETNQQNSNLLINNKFSIIADLFFQERYASIKYVKYMGTKWEVRSIDLTNYPRVIIELGGIYNGT